MQQRHHAHAHAQPLPRLAGKQLQCVCLERSSLGRCGVGSSIGGPQTSWKDECKSAPWSALESGGHRTSISSCLLLPNIDTNKYVRARAWAALRWREKDERKGREKRTREKDERKGQDTQRGTKGVSECRPANACTARLGEGGIQARPGGAKRAEHGHVKGSQARLPKFRKGLEWFAHASCLHWFPDPMVYGHPMVSSCINR